MTILLFSQVGCKSKQSAVIGYQPIEYNLPELKNEGRIKLTIDSCDTIIHFTPIDTIFIDTSKTLKTRLIVERDGTVVVKTQKIPTTVKVPCPILEKKVEKELSGLQTYLIYAGAVSHLLLLGLIILYILKR